MTWLSEDPTYITGLLGLIAASFFMALRVTQQGKYLYLGLGALGLAATVLVIEHFWITDNERIENVVYDLRRAVLGSDANGVLEHLTPDVEYVQNGTVMSGESTRDLIRANLERSAFDFIHISDLQSSAGKQTRRGKAEFRVYAKGTLQTSLASLNMGTANSTWSLGFEETAPNVWKVNRITPMTLPDGVISTSRSRGRGAPQPKARFWQEKGARGEAGRKIRPHGVLFRDERRTPAEEPAERPQEPASPAEGAGAH